MRGAGGMRDSSRQMQRRLPPMSMPQMRMPRYAHDPYRRPPPEFYDPYMMERQGPPPMYHGHSHGHDHGHGHHGSKMMYGHGRPAMPRHHPYSYRK
jgi:hypothetical protein